MTAVAQSTPVLMESRDGIYILTLNRPEKLNAANLEMQQLLVDCICAVANDQSARAMILAGAGRAFSAGGDRDILQEIASSGRAKQQDKLADIHRETILNMLALPIPAIAAVQGPAIGYAAGLVALCDFVVMGERGFLSDPHVEFGVAATTAVQIVWPQLTSFSVAKELMMTGRRVPADQALQLGLANRVCEPGKELETALEMAAVYAALPREGVSRTKRELNRSLLEAANRLLG